MFALGALAVGAGIAACVSDAGTQFNVTTVEGGSGGEGGGGSDGAVGAPDGGGSGNDSGSLTTSCMKSCSDTTMLNHCEADGAALPVHCTYDCTVDGGAHCRVFTPDPPVTVQDLAETATLGAIDFTTTGFVSTDDGTIDGVRAKNQSPTTHEVVSNIAFHVVSGVAIFTAKSVVIESAATMKVRGANAIAIIADTIAVKGTIDVRGYDGAGNLCTGNVAGPGGFKGGNGTNAGGGPGGGAVAPSIASGTSGAGGAGGGGNGGHGGAGGTFGGTNGAGPEGGAPYPLTAPIIGGSGGGSAPVDAVTGGGGGGAIELVALTSIVIGNGTSASGINAGGCHGSSGTATASGGGGGAGGTILLTSPSVTLQANGLIAANGGGGGSGPQGGMSVLAEDGHFGANTAYGATSGTAGYGQGGYGSSGITYDGFFGIAAGTTKAGGAGGGGAGRVVIRNVSGTFTVPVSAIMSPTPPGTPIVLTPLPLQ
jgi:hypothetical protein